MNARLLWATTTSFILSVWSASVSAEYLFCTKPSEPYCVGSYGDFDEWSFQQCRDEVERYVKQVGSFRDCMADEVQRLDAEAVRAADKTIERFNCKARGESFCL